MPGRSVLFLAIRLAAGIVLCAATPLPAQAGDAFEAAGQLYFTFEFGGAGEGPQRPRFGLRLGGQAVPDPADRTAELFTRSLGLELDLQGRSALSLGGLTLPLGGALFGGRATTAPAVSPRPRHGAGTALGAAPKAAADRADPSDTPLPQSGLKSAAELPVAIGRWVFWPLGLTDEARAAAVARGMIPAAGPVGDSPREPAMVEPVERGDWLFRPLDSAS